MRSSESRDWGHLLRGTGHRHRGVGKRGKRRKVSAGVPQRRLLGSVPLGALRDREQVLPSRPCDGGEAGILTPALHPSRSQSSLQGLRTGRVRLEGVALALEKPEGAELRGPQGKGHASPQGNDQPRPVSQGGREGGTQTSTWTCQPWDGTGVAMTKGFPAAAGLWLGLPTLGSR